MKTKNFAAIVLKVSFFLAFIFVFLISLTEVSRSFTAGSPNACTGSPADKNSCAQPECHEGTAVFAPGLISSDIPESGYVPGTTYTIKAVARGIASSTRFGFQVSPQNFQGDLMGTMVVTNATETKITGKGKYITQKDLGVEGVANKEYSFQWVAPPAGSGDFCFYACFLIGGKPEIITTSRLDVKEKI